MNCLVTGASGFLGGYLVHQLLARGDRVRILVRRPNAALTSPDIEVVRADIRERDKVIAACAGIDSVFHAAGVAGIWGAWDHYFSTNVEGTQNVIDGCRRHSVPRLVYTSSPSVTFDGTDQYGVDETAPYARRWLCAYPRSKALAEQRVLAANGAGLATCALRPHLIWGPGDRHLIPRLIRRAKAGRLRQVGDGRNQVDTVFVENAAAAHLRADEALRGNPAARGRAFFISQGEPVNCWAWINEVLALAGLGPVERSISAAAAWRLGAGLEILYRAARIKAEPPMTRFLAAQLSRSHYFDISAARRELAYEPRISTREGLGLLAAALTAGEGVLGQPTPRRCQSSRPARDVDE